MSIEKAWFLDHGAREGLDLKTLTNALDPRFISTAKRYCTEEEEAYVDDCSRRLQKQLDEIRTGDHL